MEGTTLFTSNQKQVWKQGMVVLGRHCISVRIHRRDSLIYLKSEASPKENSGIEERNRRS